MADARKVVPFDTATVRELALLLNEHGLTEVEVVAGEQRIRVTKAPQPLAPTATTLAVTPVATAATNTPGSGNEPPLDHPGLLSSPMVGVAYTSPEPSAPPFVRLGDTVAEGATVLLIEAMKVFNPITAHRAGRIERIFISSGAPVEYGEPLMLIV